MNIIGKLAVLAGTGLLLGFGTGIPAAHAGTHVSIRVGIAPPAPMWEPVPAPRVGFIWTPGYWRWSGAAYIWVGGRWHSHRAGYRYVHPHWYRSGHYWHFRSGYWHRANRRYWRHHGYWRHHRNWGHHGRWQHHSHGHHHWRGHDD